MKLSELIYPKQNTRRSGMFMPDAARSKGDVIRRIKDMHNAGCSPQNIWKHVRDKFGSEFLQVAEKQLNVMEAITEVPRDKEQMTALKDLFRSPLPIELAPDALRGIIQDDGLNDDIAHSKPGSDARPIIRQWIELNMPYIITPREELIRGDQGIFSTLHGYSAEDL